MKCSGSKVYVHDSARSDRMMPTESPWKVRR